MYVMTQDGKRIINATAFSVVRNLGGKNGKYAVAVTGMVHDLDVNILNTWPDEESAKAELQRVWQALASGQTMYKAEKHL